MSAVASTPQRSRAMQITIDEFVNLVRLIRNAPRDRGVQRRYALFAIPAERRLRKVATNAPRFVDYVEQYREYFVGTYDPDLRAGDLEDDLVAAGVRVCARRRR